jgi:hypothetical protein
LGKELVPDETAAKKKKAQKTPLVDLSPFANHLTAMIACYTVKARLQG